MQENCTFTATKAEEYRLWQPPPAVGYWIVGPLARPNGQFHYQTFHKPRLLVRLLAKWMLDCVWVPFGADRSKDVLP